MLVGSVLKIAPVGVWVGGDEGITIKSAVGARLLNTVGSSDCFDDGIIVALETNGDDAMEGMLDMDSDGVEEGLTISIVGSHDGVFDGSIDNDADGTGEGIIDKEVA
jgi:ligand-binding sensor domain-containing protein